MSLQKKALASVKWSYLATLLPKLMTPLAVLLIARFLDPTAYGLVAIATFVIVFANIFVNAGFSEALIQTDMPEDQLIRAKSVVFWFNLLMSVILFCGVEYCAPWLATFFHKPEALQVIRVMALSILLNGFQVVQSAMLQRTFQFKKLFYVQLWPSIVPFLVSLPLAYYGYGVWALVIGLLLAKCFQVITFYIILPWYPRLIFDWAIFARLRGFGLWVLLEGIQAWFIVHYDVFIASHYFSSADVGRYFFASNLIAMTMGLVLSPLGPVIYAYLSRVDIEEIRHRAVQLVQLTALVIMPIAIGLAVAGKYLYLILGLQWVGLGYLLVWLAISPGCSYIWVFFPDIYRSIGKPKITVFFSAFTIAYTIPMYWYAAHIGFDMFIYARFSLLVFAFFHFYVLAKVLRISLLRLLSPLVRPFFLSCIAALVFIMIDWYPVVWLFILIGIIYLFLYVGLSLLFNRQMFVDNIRRIKQAVAHKVS